jgi:serine/threonine-protein kinase
MLVGQNLGPFAIDKELGTGAMGAVYRGRYVKTGQIVAVKVMAPGIGTTNPNANARFEREAAILKQFNHPNIVRLFGIGKSHGTRYYAMEYIEGESLDRVMSRRGRISWEEVIGLGQQLCAALQHAHEQGVVHRDLKPSNLMILKDGTLKLTDFGIAKDLDVTRLTSANCTVGTAAYMSPEQCRGDPNLTHKSDLYSLGVVFYELIAGRKPFEAENAMDMFMKHVQGTYVRPSRLVLEMPPWLDTLICQLLEKEPEQRPLDAATVYTWLGKIQEKVESQQSAGVDAAKMRVIDRPPGSKPVDETDREMARTLLTGKGRKRRRKRELFYQKGWFVIAGLIALFGALAFTLFLLFGPEPPEKLYERAAMLMNSSDHEDHQKAADGPIKQFLGRFPEQSGDQADKMRRWAEDVPIEKCEDLIALYVKKKGAAFKFEAQSETEAQAFKAVDEEEEGKLAEARARWKDIEKVHGKDMWGLTAGRRLTMLDRVDKQEAEWQKKLELIRSGRREEELPNLEKKTFRAYRAEHLLDIQGKPPVADLPLARKVYENVKAEARSEMKAKENAAPDVRFWYLVAARKTRELEPETREKKEPGPDPKEQVLAVLQFATDPRIEMSDKVRRSIAMNIVAVYGEAPEESPGMEELVKRAKQIVINPGDYEGVK